MMKKITFILILFLVVLSSGIGIVSAETVTGTLGTTGLNTTSYTQIYQATGGAQPASITNLYIKDIQYTSGLAYLIRFDINAVPTFTALSPVGNTTPVLFKIGTAQIGTGTFGYQRSYVSGGTETLGYQYLVFNSDWNGSSYTGNQAVTIEGIPINGITYAISAYNSEAPPYSGAMKFGTSTNGWFGNYTIQKSLTFQNDYSATKPSGIGITGYVSKNSGGTTYPGRAWVFDGTTGAALSSEPTLSSTQFNFSTASGTIKIGVQDSTSAWYNSSILFSPTPTPTPTVTPTPAPTVEPGYVRTNVHVWDRGGAMIHGANIDIKDIGTSTWTNSTHDADGISYIDTLPYHQISIYGSYDIFANEFLPNSLLNQDTGPAGYTYFLTLYPYESGASEGNTSLYVEVKDASSGYYIPHANVQIVLSNGYSYAGSTANQGSKVFLVPNNTVVRATGSASGYLPATVIGNSGTGGSMTMTINLNKQVVTSSPTTTIPPGGVTPAITIDPNDPALHGGDTSFQGQEMMRYLANNGMTLVQLCFMVTILALLGFKFGK
jgi:hypothetical protein